jgi:hypothetical protein
MSNVTNSGQDKAQPKWVRVGAEVGVWIGIVMLIVTAAITGFGYVAELSGDTALLGQLHSVASVTMYAGLASAGAGVLAMLLTRPKV